MEASKLEGQWRSLADRFRRIASADCSDSDVKAAAAHGGRLVYEMKALGLLPSIELPPHKPPSRISDDDSPYMFVMFFAVAESLAVNPSHTKWERRETPDAESVAVGQSSKKDWRIRAENYAAICDTLADEVATHVETATTGQGGDAGNGDSQPARALEALMGVEDDEILKIARSNDSADDRMRAIHQIDGRVAAWDSRRWADLLGVTDAAIRKASWWKVDRPALIAKQRDDGD